MNLQSPLLITLRSIARRVGLTRLMSRLYNKPSYEYRFNSAMLGAIHSGDVVWDVGANVGYYTKQFAELVTKSGSVVAFEPVPDCFEKLHKNVSDAESLVKLYNVGLGKGDGSLNFKLGDTPLSPTGRFVDGASMPDINGVVSLPVFTADSLLNRDNLSIPNFVKIDVEGYEEEVVEGMKNILHSAECKNVFIEVHFTILELRGKQLAPNRIVNALKASQFQVKWIDSSHLHAYKK